MGLRAREIDLLMEKNSKGRHVGVRLAELLMGRTRQGKRETSVMAQLSFITMVVWKHLFGKEVRE
jgi:hypothetical protein